MNVSLNLGSKCRGSFQNLKCLKKNISRNVTVFDKMASDSFGKVKTIFIETRGKG